MSIGWLPRIVQRVKNLHMLVGSGCGRRGVWGNKVSGGGTLMLLGRHLELGALLDHGDGEETRGWH